MEETIRNQHQGRGLTIGFLLILGVAVWYGGRIWYENRQEESAVLEEEETSSEVSLAEPRFLTPKELLARLSRQEDILFIDVRTKEDFDIEHLVDSVSVPVTTLDTFTPPQGTGLITIVSGPEIPNATLKGIHELFKEKKYTFAFLQGSITDWKLAGGTTVSTGDPTSIFDYSKVIFVTPQEVMTLVDEVGNPLFLDVREESAFKERHIPGALNIPLEELEDRRTEIPRGKSLFVYGANDYESYQGGVRLFDLNFFGARVIQGGFLAWKEKNLPLSQENSEPKTAN